MVRPSLWYLVPFRYLCLDSNNYLGETSSKRKKVKCVYFCWNLILFLVGLRWDLAYRGKSVA